uniref:Rhomboid family intramembrane serine protease n=1 Tax=candidate division WOR-3 bacterium TaxID=2052148 RepID=A0A7C4GGK6_UNCW3
MIPLYDDIRSRRRPYVNYCLIAACTLVWIIQFRSQLAGEGLFDQMILQYGMIPQNILAGQRLWTLVTSIFLHGGWFHFLGNMLYLWIFGDNVEDAFGHLFYPLVYLFSGVAGNGLQLTLSANTTIPTIGASGAISGVLGAYFVLYPRAQVVTLIPFFIFLRIVRLPAAVLLGFWILFQVISGCGSIGRTGGGVAYLAHVGGFAAGLLCGLLVRRRVQRPWYEIE